MGFPQRMEPILARAVPALPWPDALPGGTVFEPKWDGYRLLVYAAGGGRAQLLSRHGTDLSAAFPEIADAVARVGEDLVVDGEVVILVGGRLDFTALQKRLSRPVSTTRRLAAEQPAYLVAFDLLQRRGRRLAGEPYRVRRAELERLFTDHDLVAPWTLCPSTTDRARAQEWMREWAAVGVEGVVAKGLGQSYQPGQRGWYKVRAKETAEAVIGAVTGPPQQPTTVLLGRYDTGDVLRLVARSSPLAAPMRQDIGRLLTPAGAEHPWTGARFATGWGARDPLTFTTVRPEHVAEFAGDAAIDHGRWRHSVRFLRLRPDISPRDLPRTD